MSDLVRSPNPVIDIFRDVELNDLLEKTGVTDSIKGLAEVNSCTNDILVSGE